MDVTTDVPYVAVITDSYSQLHGPARLHLLLRSCTVAVSQAPAAITALPTTRGSGGQGQTQRVS